MLPRRIGLQKAKELVFFGDDLSAADAERIGLVNKVVPAAELEATAKEWAERLATGPTRTIGFAKRLLNRSLDIDRESAFEEEALAEWEVCYNTVRPHQALGYLTTAEWLDRNGYPTGLSV